MHNAKSKTYIAILVVLGVMLFPVTFKVNAFDITAVRIDPSLLTIEVGDTFTVNVSCVPGQVIKGFEFKLSFNPSILRANGVTEGNIFHGHTTYFNPGTIDNDGGTIVNVYDLILEPGNASNNGTFATISFTAQSTTGTDSIHLYDVGVTNENGYVPIMITNGTITVEGINNPPAIVTVNPVNGSTSEKRPPNELNSTIEDSDSSLMDVFIRWKNHTGKWITLTTLTGVGNGTYNFTPSGNDWIWGNTTYTWSVNVTDGTYWTDRTYQYTTNGSRYDVTNDNDVNFQDAGLVWTHQTSLNSYDGLYDVNQDRKVNFQDAGLTWTHRN